MGKMGEMGEMGEMGKNIIADFRKVDCQIDCTSEEVRLPRSIED